MCVVFWSTLSVFFLNPHSVRIPRHLLSSNSANQGKPRCEFKVVIFFLYNWYQLLSIYLYSACPGALWFTPAPSPNPCPVGPEPPGPFTLCLTMLPWRPKCSGKVVLGSTTATAAGQDHSFSVARWAEVELGRGGASLDCQPGQHLGPHAWAAGHLPPCPCPCPWAPMARQARKWLARQGLWVRAEQQNVKARHQGANGPRVRGHNTCLASGAGNLRYALVCARGEEVMILAVFPSCSSSKSPPPQWLLRIRGPLIVVKKAAWGL